MRVTVRLFAMLRERAGASELALELPEGARVRDAMGELGELAHGLPLVIAVNREYALEDQALRPGDELALIPPVSGGGPATGGGEAAAGVGPAAGSVGEAAGVGPAAGGGGRTATVYARVTGDPLSLDGLADRVSDPRAGAVVTFQGLTRDVDRLEYEAYIEMAQEKLEVILEETVSRHGLCAAAAEHRVGGVPLSEPSVVVAVSAPHRAEAFAGAREVIDRVKAEAPIWKKEVAGGEGRWVEGALP